MLKADVGRLFSTADVETTAGDIFTNEQNRILPENGEKKSFFVGRIFP